MLLFLFHPREIDRIAVRGGRMEDIMAAKKEKYLTYKGKPLVRSGNTIFYGDLKEKYVIFMQILDTKKVGDMEIGNKILIQLQYTDPEIKTKDKVVKKSEKTGLYNALDIASIWLDRALSK